MYILIGCSVKTSEKICLSQLFSLVFYLLLLFLDSVQRSRDFYFFYNIWHDAGIGTLQFRMKLNPSCFALPKTILYQNVQMCQVPKQLQKKINTSTKCFFTHNNYWLQVTLPCRVENKVGFLQWTRDGFGLGETR